MEGWIKLHRGLLESQIFASEKGLKIWIWVLLKANHKKKYVPIKVGKGESIVEVNRGEFIFGRFTAEEEVSIDGSTIYKWMKKMESLEMISLNSNSHYTIVTVNKFNEYNDNENEEVATNRQPLNNQKTATRQPRNTTKNEKNEKKSNNVFSSFYDLEIEKSNNDENYIRFVKTLFGENNLKIELSNVLSLKYQLSFAQFQLVFNKKNEYKISLTALLEDMENTNGFTKKYTSLQRTMLNWMERRKQ